MAWVLRNHNGDVISQSRIAFNFVASLNDANVLCHLWAIDIMCNLRVPNVIFATKTSELVEAVFCPPAWPAFRA